MSQIQRNLRLTSQNEPAIEPISSSQVAGVTLPAANGIKLNAEELKKIRSMGPATLTMQNHSGEIEVITGFVPRDPRPDGTVRFKSDRDSSVFTDRMFLGRDRTGQETIFPGHYSVRSIEFPEELKRRANTLPKGNLA